MGPNDKVACIGRKILRVRLKALTLLISESRFSRCLPSAKIYRVDNPEYVQLGCTYLQATRVSVVGAKQGVVDAS